MKRLRQWPEPQRFAIWFIVGIPIFFVVTPFTIGLGQGFFGTESNDFPLTFVQWLLLSVAMAFGTAFLFARRTHSRLAYPIVAAPIAANDQFGAWVKLVREQYVRWTVPQLAHFSAVPDWQIAGIEAGHITQINEMDRQKIVAALQRGYGGQFEGPHQ